MTPKTFLIATSLALTATFAAAENIKLSVTTSFANSGLAEVLLPEIAKDIDLNVQLLIVGTGQALELGANGDVDAVLVHSRKAEEKWLAEGNGTHRREIMYNDFVIIGPSVDPAGIKTSATATDALKAIEATKSKFVSRGDDSGTHKMELALWQNAGVTAEGDWYASVGQGMGAALNTAAGMNAYILADRASWLNFANKADLAIAFEGDPVLFNQYAYMPVNPEKHAHVKADAAAKLEAWLTSPRAKELIESYQIGGQQLFVFNASIK
jgi:tungstate transport system substrate-binding protein